MPGPCPPRPSKPIAEIADRHGGVGCYSRLMAQPGDDSGRHYADIADQRVREYCTPTESCTGWSPSVFGGLTGAYLNFHFSRSAEQEAVRLKLAAEEVARMRADREKSEAERAETESAKKSICSGRSGNQSAGGRLGTNQAHASTSLAEASSSKSAVPGASHHRYQNARMRNDNGLPPTVRAWSDTIDGRREAVDRLRKEVGEVDFEQVGPVVKKLSDAWRAYAQLQYPGKKRQRKWGGAAKE